MRRKVARLILTEEDPGLELLHASNGEQALSMLQKEAPYQDAPGPDLILLDLNMPKKNGLEVLADLKADKLLRSIPVVIFSTSSLQRDQSRSLALGANGYVRKPSSLDSLREALKRACSLPVGVESENKNPNL